MRKLAINRNKPTDSSNNNSNNIIEGRVYSVIIDSTHPKYTGEDSIGVIFYGKVKTNQRDIRNLDGLAKAKPYFAAIKHYPVKYEIVQIIPGTGNNPYKDSNGDIGKINNYYLPPTNTHNNPNHNSLPLESDIPKPKNEPREANVGIQQNDITSPTTQTRPNGYLVPNRPVRNRLLLWGTGESLITETEEGKRTVRLSIIDPDTELQYYGEATSFNLEAARRKAREQAEERAANALGLAYWIQVDESQIPNEEKEDADISLGETFNENSQVKKLQPREGDVTIEGRDGTAVRMGSGNPISQGEGTGPIVTISSGLPLTDADATVEDINETGASLVMTSDQNISNLQVASYNQRSLGVEFTEPTNEDVIIEDTPSPYYSLPPAEVIEFVDEPEILTEQDLLATPTILNPEETTYDPLVGDPIFALLDEAEDAGEIEPLIPEIFIIAGSEPDEGDEEGGESNSGDSGAGTGSPSGATNFRGQDWANLKTRWRNGESVDVYNKKGRKLTVRQPSRLSVTNNPGNRTIKYLWIHTTGQGVSANPLDLLHLHFVDNNWEYPGYNIVIPRTAKAGEAVRLHPDSVKCNGVGGKRSRDRRTYGENKNAINISWIGGYNGLDITQTQAYTLKELILAYVKAYPDIQVGGHNQMGRSPDTTTERGKQLRKDGIPEPNSCPNFYVPKYCELLEIPEKNIFRGGYFGQQDGSDPNSTKYKAWSQTLFDLHKGL